MDFSVDEPEKLTKTVVNTHGIATNGAPFVARLILIFSLKTDFHLDQIIQLMKIMYNATRIIYLDIFDNLKNVIKVCSQFFTKNMI